MPRCSCLTATLLASVPAEKPGTGSLQLARDLPSNEANTEGVMVLLEYLMQWMETAREIVGLLLLSATHAGVYGDDAPGKSGL